MATYYVNGSGATYTDPQGNVWGIGNDANAGTRAAPKATWLGVRSIYGNNDTVVIAPATYVESLSSSTPVATGITVRAADPANKPLLGPAANGHGILCDDASFVFRDLKITWNGATRYGGYLSANNLTFYNVEFLLPTSDYAGIILIAGTGLKFYNCLFDSLTYTASDGNIVVVGTVSADFYYCHFMGSPIDAGTLGMIRQYGANASVVNFVNCLER